MSAHPTSETPSPLRKALLRQRPLALRAAAYSFISGTLMLAPSWYMFEVYGRVVDSRNLRTLWMLLLAVLLVYAIVELIDIARSRLLHRLADHLDADLRRRVFDAIFQANLRRPSPGNAQPLSDLKALRDFIPSPTLVAFLDIPAALLFLALLWAMGPWLGAMATSAAVLQGLIAWSTERRTMPMLGEATRAQMAAQNYASGTLRNAQVIEAMGMLDDVHRRWSERQRQFIGLQSKASDIGGLNAVAAKITQQMQSSLLLGAACWLSLRGELWGGPGMAIVASILGGRALQPMAVLVSQWRTTVLARESWQRLSRLLTAMPEAQPGMALPPPKGALSVEQVVAAAPALPGQVQTPAILKGVSFAVRPGEMVAVIGPSAAGKTTLARVLVGVWPAATGKVRLDGADVFAWNKAELGPSVGYLPQGVELFDGTVAENIARFGTVDLELVRAAAAEVGMLQTLDDLPEGLDTRIGEDGAVLSGGQRQRVALARALYGNPRFLVLDEPNASLDQAGDQALAQCLQRLKARGATVIAITHRTNLLAHADKLLLLNDGQVMAFGPPAEVMAALNKANEQARARAIAPASVPPPAAPPALPAAGGARA